jgi:HSP20 family protein
MLRSPLLNEFAGLRNAIDQLFGENPFGDTFNTLWSRAESSGWSVARPMPLDVYATDDAVVIVAAVPGMQPDDLQLTVQQNTLTLSGHVRGVAESQEAKGASWYLHEVPSGAYRRSLTLPFAVDADHANATFEHGILRVVLPKTEAAKPKRIEINGGSTRQTQAIGAGTSS